MAIIVTSATVAVAALVIVVQLLLSHATTSETIHLAQARATAAASTVRVVHGHASVLEGPADFPDQNLWIFDGTGTRIGGAAPTASLRSRVLALSTVRRSTTVTIAGTRLFATPVVDVQTGHALAVVVAGLDLAPYEASEQRGLLVSLVLGALVVVAAGTATWASVGVSLRQVRSMARRADDWREHDLSRRFELGDPVDEVTELGRTLDGMLDRITAALHSERRLTDEVAHELRTPLSVIRSEAQLGLLKASRPAAKDESLRAIVASTERMERAISTMLMVARSAHRDEAERCSVTDSLAIARQHAPRVHGVSLTTEEVSGDLRVAAPEAVVVAALTPLLDNAVRHARTRVRLTAALVNERVVIAVHDDGPGVDEADREVIFQPGRTSRDHGSGLGLSLSRRLAHSMGGEVQARAVGHGMFVLELPAV